MPFPDEFRPYQESWLRFHSGWELRFWTEETLPDDLRRREVYQRLRVPAERADILRLEVLWRYGGVYVDVDFECLRPLEPLLEGVDFCTAYKKPGQVNNAFIASTAGHPILDRALDEVRPRKVYGYDKAAAGPKFLTKLLKKQFPEATIFDSALFYARSPEELEQAYAVHHRARSWQDVERLRYTMGLLDKRLQETREEASQWRARYEHAVAELERLKPPVAG
jgi:inositol phosphorylceramide mannosyltransferase catalytic subunit